MENTAIVLIIVTLFLLVIIIGLLALLVFKLFHNQPATFTNPSKTEDGPSHPDRAKSEFHPEILERMREMEKVKLKRSDLFCPNHTDEPGEVSCAICDQLFCKACIKPFKSLHFCREHLPLIMRHEWVEVFTVKTSTQNPEDGVNLYEAKKHLFQAKDIPTYIETHYKINVDQDYIETYLVVFATEDEVEVVRSNLNP